MSEAIFSVPVISALTIGDLDRLGQHHDSAGLTLKLSGAQTSLAFGADGEQASFKGSIRLVSELLRLAQFALLVLDQAERSPRKTVLDVVAEVHHQLRSR